MRCPEGGTEQQLLLCSRLRAAVKLLRGLQQHWGELSCRHGRAAVRGADFTVICTCLAGGAGATEPAPRPTLQLGKGCGARTGAVGEAENQQELLLATLQIPLLQGQVQHRTQNERASTIACTSRAGGAVVFLVTAGASCLHLRVALSRATST